MDQVNIFLRVFIFSFGVICLCIAIAAGYIEKKTLTLTASTLGIILIAFGYFGNLKKLSLPFNLEAEFHQAISEAYATIEQMRNLAVVSSKSILTDLMAGGFMGSMSLETRLNMHDQLISNLRNLEVSPEAIKGAEEMWAKGIGIIYHRAIVHELGQRNRRGIINTSAPAEVQEASNQLQDMGEFDGWNAPSPSEIESFINERGLMTENLSKWISDYRHFVNTGEIRRRNLFVLQ